MRLSPFVRTFFCEDSPAVRGFGPLDAEQGETELPQNSNTSSFDLHFPCTLIKQLNKTVHTTQTVIILQ